MKNFCVLPWVGKEISFNSVEKHCCLLPSGYDIKKIQAKMLVDERPEECRKCYHLEDNGMTSDRMLKNSLLDWVWDKDIEVIKQEIVSEDPGILMLKLITSHTCNAACIICNAETSSHWAHLKRRHDKTIPIRSYPSVDIDRLKRDIDFSKLKTLAFQGGEPLYEKRNFEILEHLLALGNDKIFLSFVTNGSTVIADRHKKLLSKFPNINFSISIDGIGPVFEYCRFPLKWQLLLENLDFFRSITKNISTNYTINNINIWYHQQTIDWFVQQGVPYIHNPMYNPDYWQPRALSRELKDLLKQKLSHSDYMAFIGQEHTEEDQKRFERFLQEIKKQDDIKKIKMQEYVPEVYELLLEYL